MYSLFILTLMMSIFISPYRLLARGCAVALLSLLSLPLPVASSPAPQGSLTIKGKVEGLAQGRLLLIVRTAEDKADTIGTTPFNAQTPFTLRADLKEPVAAQLMVQGYSGGFLLMAEPGATYTALLKDGKGSCISGGPLQDAYNGYLRQVEERQRHIAVMQTKSDSLRALAMYRSASAMNDSAGHLRERLIEYVDNFHHDNDNVISAYDALTLAQARNLDARATARLYDGLGEQARQSLSGRILLQRVQRLSRLARGQKAPDFTLPTIDGKTFTLSKMGGKVRIVDFWASWCGPCRLNNPALKDLYARYRDKGLEIVSVSLDNNRQRWTDAVAKDGLPWTQVSSLKGWGDATARLYNVTAIPAIFVLNDKGEIIARDIRGKNLEQLVDEYLKQQ